MCHMSDKASVCLFENLSSALRIQNTTDWARNACVCQAFNAHYLDFKWLSTHDIWGDSQVLTRQNMSACLISPLSKCRIRIVMRGSSLNSARIISLPVCRPLKTHISNIHLDLTNYGCFLQLSFVLSVSIIFVIHPSSWYLCDFSPDQIMGTIFVQGPWLRWSWDIPTASRPNVLSPAAALFGDHKTRGSDWLCSVTLFILETRRNMDTTKFQKLRTETCAVKLYCVVNNKKTSL